MTGIEEIKTCQNNKISIINEKKLGILMSEEERLRNLYNIYYFIEQPQPILLIIAKINKKKVWGEIFAEEFDCSYIRGFLLKKNNNIITMNFIDKMFFVFFFGVFYDVQIILIIKNNKIINFILNILFLLKSNIFFF